jgi:hypothetical protein
MPTLVIPQGYSKVPGWWVYKPAWIEDPWLQFKPLSDTPGTMIPQGFTNAFPNMSSGQRLKLVRAANKEKK